MKKWEKEINTPVPDIMINGEDGPLTLRTRIPPTWLLADRRSKPKASRRTGGCSSPGTSAKTPGGGPIRRAGRSHRSRAGGGCTPGPERLRRVHRYPSEGFYEFTFAVDEKNGNYEGTYLDTAQVTGLLMPVGSIDCFTCDRRFRS